MGLNSSQRGDYCRLASIYDQLACLASLGLIKRSQAAAIPYLRDGQHWLWLGGGTGEILPMLLSQHPRLRITYVDSSASMIRLAQQRLRPQQRQRVNFITGTEADLPATVRFDGLLTCFFLDLFAEKELLHWVQVWGATLRPGAKWIVVDFNQPRQGWGVWPARLVLTGLYQFFGWTTGLQTRRLPDWEGVLVAAGWRQQASRQWLGGMLRLWVGEGTSDSARL